MKKYTAFGHQSYKRELKQVSKILYKKE